MKQKILNLICASLLAINLQATVRYVTENGSGIKDGSSWANASGDLQEMINASNEGDEIWVAAGTYTPIRRAGDGSVIIGRPEDRDRAFVLKKDVKIYGSFSGTETALEQRQLPAPENYNYTSILSGDFKGDDGADFTNMNENAYHVVISAGDVGTALLDGFTIQGGNANESGYGDITVNSQNVFINRGGGLYITYSSPAFTNISISGNTATSSAGGIYCANSSSVFTNVSISGNIANFAGGMSNLSSSPTLTNVIISGNTARNGDGGGIYSNNALFSSPPVLTNVSISGNMATGNGGGMYNVASSVMMTNVNINENTSNRGGGIFNSSSSSILATNVIISGNTAGNGGGVYNTSSSPVLTNVNISKNTADYGGGIYNIDSSSPVLTNISISGNTANSGGGIYNAFSTTSSNPKTRNSIIWDNGEASINVYNNVYNYPVYSYSLVEGVVAEGVILAGEDPLFVDAANGDFHLQEGSPCIDAGSNSFFEAGQTPNLSVIITDLAGKPRIYGNNIDLGAYEYQPILLVSSITVTGTGGATTITTDGGTLQMSANVLPANATDNSVTWSVTPGTGDATINTSGLLTATANGTVMVRATANDGSGVYGELEITISGQEETTSVKTLQTANKLIVYPNPTDGVIYIETTNDIVPVIKLYSLLGEQILETNGNKVDLSVFDKGVYLLQVDGEMIKVVKK